MIKAQPIRSVSTLDIRKRLIAIADAEVGVREVPKDSNTGKRVKEYQAATDLDGTRWPYCAAFVCWCIREWGKLSEVRDALMMTAAQFEVWRPKTPAAYGFDAWAVKKGLLVMNENTHPGEYILHTADLVNYDFSHAGILDTDRGNVLLTVEGNTDAAGSRDGGGVYRKTRARSFARKFIRLLA